MPRSIRFSADVKIRETRRLIRKNPQLKEIFTSLTDMMKLGQIMESKENNLLKEIKILEKIVENLWQLINYNEAAINAAEKNTEEKSESKLKKPSSISLGELKMSWALSEESCLRVQWMLYQGAVHRQENAKKELKEYDTWEDLGVTIQDLFTSNIDLHNYYNSLRAQAEKAWNTLFLEKTSYLESYIADLEDAISILQEKLSSIGVEFENTEDEWVEIEKLEHTIMQIEEDIPEAALAILEGQLQSRDEFYRNQRVKEETELAKEEGTLFKAALTRGRSKSFDDQKSAQGSKGSLSAKAKAFVPKSETSQKLLVTGDVKGGDELSADDLLLKEACFVADDDTSKISRQRSRSGGDQPLGGPNRVWDPIRDKNTWGGHYSLFGLPAVPTHLVLDEPGQTSNFSVEKAPTNNNS